MWTFPGNLRMQGDSGRILEQLLEALKAKATPAFTAGRGGARRSDIDGRARRDALAPRREARGRQGQARRDQSALSVAELGKVLDAETSSSTRRSAMRRRG